jgi:uncharacterized protein YqgC (DUF456 family)
MAILALIAVLLLGLVMIPFGMPGTLVMFCGALGYKLLQPHGGIGWATVIIAGLLMAFAEAMEWVLTGRYTRKYGGSRRASWGAVIGGMIGAFIGVPIPLIGPVIGAFVGAFAGAFVGEMSRGSGGGTSTRVAWGAFVGRVVGAALKMGVGVAMLSWIIFAAMT